MNQKNVTEIARLIKENRLLKNYTQQELADMTGISLRSIQRIENAEVSPRLYTLKTLAGRLDFALEPQEQINTLVKAPINQRQKIILSVGSAVLLFLLAMAYVFQSPTFPEDAFELFLYIAAFVGVYTVMMFRIWK
ncbi:helix-turn-helix domain-containing protein [Mucilaginibacter sp. UYCu711]|uniref:helix-turn-helix domain-containing protein n=1 Tax=Mucilaginibacter sp. UYCu711 TaxID=3156339 RepID=UPI003D194BA4